MLFNTFNFHPFLSLVLQTKQYVTGSIGIKIFLISISNICITAIANIKLNGMKLVDYQKQ